MTQLIDPSLVGAYQMLMDRRAAASKALADGVASGVGGLAQGLIQRGANVRNTRQQAQHELQRIGDVQRRAEDELQAIGSIPDRGPYEQAFADARTQQLQGRIDAIGSQRQQLQDLSSMPWRKVNPRLLPQPVQEEEPALLGGRLKDIDAGIAAQREAEKQRLALEKEARARERFEEAEANKMERVRVLAASKPPTPLNPAYKKEIDEYDSILDKMNLIKSGIEEFEAAQRGDPEVEWARITAPELNRISGNLRSEDMSDRVAATAEAKVRGYSAPDIELHRKYASMLEEVSAEIRSGRFGAALSKNDLKLAKDSLFTTGDSIQTIRAKLRTLMSIAQKGRARQVNKATAQGQNVQGYERYYNIDIGDPVGNADGSYEVDISELQP